MDTPFDNETMTIILGLGDPMEPGMHGKMDSPMPDKTAIDLISSIRDMCDDWLMKCGKCDKENNKSDMPENEPSDNE